MKKVLSIVAGLVIGASAYSLDLHPGWQLKGALEDINVSKFNNPNIISVWTYDGNSGKWKAYIPNQSIDLSKYGIENLDKINQGEGFWVNSNNYLTIDTTVNVYKDKLNLIDKPTEFNLSDIAGKTFKIITNEGIKDLTFDENGDAKITIYKSTYNVKFDNGIIKAYINGELVSEFKKVKSDDNGIVILGTDYDKKVDDNETRIETYEYLDAWSININPVDMSTLEYPKTFYNEWGGKITVENNGTIIAPWGEENYTIEDGKIVTQEEYVDDENNGFQQKESYQIVNQIDRYYVVKIEGNEQDWYTDENLTGKTFDDIIDSNLSIEGLYLHSDGTATTENDEDEEDVNITYEKISDTQIKVTQIYNDGDEWKYTLTIDPDTGKVTYKDEFTYQEIWSESPIVKETSERRKVISKKDYLKLKRERIKKRIF